MAKYDLWRGFNASPPGWAADACAKLTDAKRKLADWFNDGQDRGEALVLAGNCGSGKTHLALVVMTACHEPLPLMIGEPDMLVNIRASYDGDGSEKFLIAGYRQTRLLIIDDVGTAHVRPESQPWLEDIYWRILDRRAELKRPLLLTTNLRLPELAERIGGRAFSRLRGMMDGANNYVDLFGVPDYRTLAWKP